MRFSVLAMLTLLGCHKDDEANRNRVEPTFGDGLFEEGCPTPGESLAREIGVDGFLPGKTAVGTRGDFLLANDRAALIVTDVEGQATYWYYGGAIADAVPMEGCEPGEDKLDDLGFVLAEINLGAIEQSVVRGFRAESVEVLNDGSNGEAAIVRAIGTDDMHWLVEYTLIGDALNKGGRPLSEPFGTQITIDYILPPDSNVLEIEVTVENVGSSSFALVEAALLALGDTMDSYAYSSEGMDIAGFSFAGGLPWIMATDGDGAYAWGIGDATLATMNIAGITIIADLAQLSGGLNLAPGQSRTLTRYFSVGDRGGTSATEGLLEANPIPILDNPAQVGVITGHVVDQTGKSAMSEVVTQAKAPGAEWGDLDVVSTSTEGDFRAIVPDFDGEQWQFRLVARDPGRDDSPAVRINPGDVDVELVVPPRGTLTFDITDGEGAPSPGRLVAIREGGADRDFWISGTGAVSLPPGEWDWTVTRGYEFASQSGSVTIPDDGVGDIAPVMVRMLDTTGWMSADTHVHTSDSPDSDMDQGEQLRHAAAHGLEIVIHTEHEAITESVLPTEAGVADWVNNVAAEEVTSITIEHMTLFPAVPDGSIRGGPVEWYGLDIEVLLGNMRARSGEGVSLMNHPGYLDKIGWDRLVAEPTLADPTLLGLPAGSPLWSWNLDGIEVMNGHGNVFNDGNRRFDNWMSMINAGHRLAGVGCSDDHHGDQVGFPRTYFASGTDDPASYNESEMTEAFRNGNIQASAGGFARVDIDGAGPGELVTDDDGLVDLNVHLEALPEIDMTHFVVFVNCDQVDSVRVTDPDAVEKFDGVIPLNIVGDSHVLIAAFGSNKLAEGLPQYDATRVARVLTNPIYVDGDGDAQFSAPGGRECSYDLDESLAL